MPELRQNFFTKEWGCYRYRARQATGTARRSPAKADGVGLGVASALSRSRVANPTRSNTRSGWSGLGENPRCANQFAALAREVPPARIADLGRVVRTVLGKLYFGLEDPDFNLRVRTAPAECVGVK